MGTSTPAPLNLYKPDDGELVDVMVQLDDNFDKTNTWAIGKDLSELKLLGGKIRDSGDSAAIDDSPEVIVVDTGTILCPADSLIEVRNTIHFFVGGASGELWDFSTRETDVSGTKVREVTSAFTPVAVPLTYQYSYFFKTTTAVSKFFVSTVHRLGGSTGTLTAQNGTSSLVYRVGPSSLAGSF